MVISTNLILVFIIFTLICLLIYLNSTNSRKIADNKSNERSIIMNNIYKNSIWGNRKETRSGDGSTIVVNKFRVKFIDKIINDYSITDMYDICGDANWQKSIKNLEKINYYGFDISEIAINNAIQKNKNNKFMNFIRKPIDLCNTILPVKNPDSTVILIKEVIQHLPLEDGLNMLKNIKKSKIKYILITNHDQNLFNVKSNINIKPGDFYHNNIFLPPFNFVNPIDDISNYIDINRQKAYGNLILFNIQEQDI